MTGEQQQQRCSSLQQQQQQFIAVVMVLLLLLGANGSNISTTTTTHAHNNPISFYNSRSESLATELRLRLEQATNRSDQLDLVFLIDASASVGEVNFRGELSFVRKLLSDFTMGPTSTRVAVVTFAGKGQVVRRIDRVSRDASHADKCRLLNVQLDRLDYSGGGTYTYGALLEAFSILEGSQRGNSAEKIVFLVTDGFSNGGDPRHAAGLLKALGVTIFSFGIRSGNVRELRDIASQPGYAYSYFLDSFAEFEALARKALHRDLRAGVYALVNERAECKILCQAIDNATGTRLGNSKCCDPVANCGCGTSSGHYACICPPGYFGNGLVGSCQPCPNGTYGQQNGREDLSVWCVPCPDVNHVTIKIPALSSADCVCASGFIHAERATCEAITCQKLEVPENGYFVKANECNNVVNAACGIRCRIGFQLIGDSIRLCSKDGSWTGIETQCLLKTCAALRAPTNGRIRCEHEYVINNSNKISDKIAQPIDTRCQFQCDHGFQLRGSKVRNCLPLARWDGLKATCKPIHCEPLKAVVNAEIQPKICLGPKKLPYGSNCMITCEKGYKLEGPKTRICVGRHGTWSKRHRVSRCIDKTRPVLICPTDITETTLPGKNYTYVYWSLPNATDNSGVDCNVWSKPHVTFPWKVQIGKHTIKYIAQDISGNRARCTFFVNVIDKEPPVIENCYNHQLLTNISGNSLEDLSIWVDPIFYDNSGLPVKVTKVVQLTTEPNFVAYTAVDEYGNSDKCLVDLTIKYSCVDPIPLNGHADCKNMTNGGRECVIFCDDGYDFTSDENLRIFKDTQAYVWICDPKNHSYWNNFTPDCSRKSSPTTIMQEGIVTLNRNSVDCNDTTSLSNLAKKINDSYSLNLINVCGNDVMCNITYEMNCNELLTRSTRNTAEDVFASSEANKSNVSRYDRSRTRKDQIELKFTFIAKIIEDNRNNTQHGATKLRESIEAISKLGQLNPLDSETHQQIERLSLNLHSIFKDPQEVCEAGSVRRKKDCVKCNAGTFHNRTRGQCQPCPLGEFQNAFGSTVCEKCPRNFYTRRLHAKSITECIAACEPGHYSRRRQHQQHPDLAGLGLAPCVSCEIGFYQAYYGQSQCLPCPSNSITETRAAISIDNCLPLNRSILHVDLCSLNPCANRAICHQAYANSFNCECRDHYVGSRCEIFVDPCLSSPCSNAGQCILRNNSIGDWTYRCSCKPGYTGTFCETLINECSYSPCRNGGSCSATDIDISCTCRDGFEGDFCELVVNQCESLPCENNSTCLTVDGSWKCICKPGYLGLRCGFLPCDWLPCHPNQICINLFQENANRSSYRCECPYGYDGRDCLTRIDHCKSHPCQNNGTCINSLLDYKCNCHVSFTGSTCEIKLISDYVMHFTTSGTTDYVTLPGPTHNLTELTVCFWMQSSDTFNYGTVISYATFNQDNAFTLTDYSGFVLYVNGERVITDVRLNDGYWHFLCVVWENNMGSWQFYVDGAQRDNGTLLAKSSQIQAKGRFVFGQEQDEVGGGFSESEAFIGKLYLLDIWDKAHGPEIIRDLSNTCKDYHGSLIAWVQLHEGIRGNVKLINSSFCQRCPKPAAPFKGFVNISDDGSEAIYSCETGYDLRKGYERIKTFKKICMKHGNWIGSVIPNCVRVACPFPEYFLRGQIYGRSYLYGDKILYNCNDGYRLKGNAERVCTADGKWSGTAPFCMGVTCKNLLAPDHGDFDYVVAEHERDDLSILQVGQQLEFKCDAGYFLNGKKTLTCLQNGTWNFERPLCLPMSCPQPEQITHKHSVKNVTSQSQFSTMTSLTNYSSNNKLSNESFYFYGDILAVTCKKGYKFEDNHNSSIELKLRCTLNGTWTGSVPNCVSLGCPQPILVENAITYLLKQDRQEIVYESYSKIDETTASSNKINTTADVHYVVGAQIKIVCRKGFEMVQGSTIRTCTENETWSDEDVRCEILQCPVTELDNHPIIQVFSKNTEEREFQALEQKSDTVKNFLEEFSFSIEGFNYGHKIIIQCNNYSNHNYREKLSNGTRLTFIWECDETKKWRFLNENWHENNITNTILKEEINICSYDKCSPLNPPFNGQMEYTNRSETALEIGVVFKCDLGYRLIGAEKSYCLLNRTWTSIPKCQAITCAGLPKVLHAEVNNGGIKIRQSAFGTTISYQCMTGYRIFGQLKSQCLASGIWSKVNGRCARISCGRPQLTSGASIQGNSYLYQDRLIYVCPDGKFRDFIVCNRDGKWSNLPKCKS